MEASSKVRVRTGAVVDDRGSTAVPAGEIPSLDGSAARFFLGTSPDAILLRRAVYRLRLYRDPVLVLGESGSGKELVSRMVHENSPVRDGPFIPVNASCLPEALAESQLFGTVRGAFTGAESHSGYFESADGGTLFLDEVAELTPSLQAKLLRVVEDGMITRVGSTGARRVSVRLICASNRDLGEMVGQGMFRADLYFVPGHIPMGNGAGDQRGCPCIDGFRQHGKRVDIHKQHPFICIFLRKL